MKKMSWVFIFFLHEVLFCNTTLLIDWLIDLTLIVYVSSDIRELIQVDDVMEDQSLRFGPNGGLVFCMEYFVNNFDWLEESLGHVEDDYILFDCPGKHCSRGTLSLWMQDVKMRFAVVFITTLWL